MTLTVDGVSSSGGALFNITTRDFLSSRTCDGDPDLIWSHQGTFQCGDAQAAHAAFNRSALWIEPRSIGGAAFAKVLCPHVAFSPGVRANIDVDDLPALCSGLTFNNCEVYYDALQATVPSSLPLNSTTLAPQSSHLPPPTLTLFLTPISSERQQHPHPQRDAIMRLLSGSTRRRTRARVCGGRVLRAMPSDLN